MSNRCRKCGAWLMVDTARPTPLTPRYCQDCPPARRVPIEAAAEVRDGGEYGSGRRVMAIGNHSSAVIGNGPGNDDVATVQYLNDAADGPGWYYHDDEYPDEGVTGAFATWHEAQDHASQAYGIIVVHARTTPGPAVIVAGEGDVEVLRYMSQSAAAVDPPQAVRVTITKAETGALSRATIVDSAELVALLRAVRQFQLAPHGYGGHATDEEAAAMRAIEDWDMPPALHALLDGDK